VRGGRRMRSSRSGSPRQAAGAELSLAGLAAPVARRPGSAALARHVARSVSVAADGKAKRNALVSPEKPRPALAARWEAGCAGELSSPGSSLLLLPSPGFLLETPLGLPGFCLHVEQGLMLPLSSLHTRSNKGAMGNCVTTMVHNNYSTSDKGPAPKSSNQAPSSLNFPHQGSKLCPPKPGEGCSEQSSWPPAAGCGWGALLTLPFPCRFIQQVNLAAVTIQRWYRHHSQRHRMGAAALGQLLASKREERQQQMEEGNILDLHEKKDEERRKIREEKARQARRAAVQVGRRLQLRGWLSPASWPSLRRHPGRPGLPAFAGSRRGGQAAGGPGLASWCSWHQLFWCSFGAWLHFRGHAANRFYSLVEPGGEDLEMVATAASRAQSKVTLNELLDTLRLLEEEPELLPQPKLLKKDKYAWIDGESDSNSLTADNLEKFGKLNHSPGVPEDGALLSEAKLQSIISFLDEMEKSEQERPRSAASATQREVSAEARGHSCSIMRLKLEVEEKQRAVSLLQTALAQQRELTVRHVKQTETELSQQLRLQREQYEAAIQRHLTFIDKLIDDKKVLSEKCEAVVAELKQVDQKYSKKIAQMQEQHELEIKKLKELMSATEKIRREKWMDEKTKKIKEITVKGLEPEIQKLIAKHKQDIKKLKVLHEAELLQCDERAAQRYSRQAEELRKLLQREREQQSQRERELARQRCEKHLEQEEQALQQQRRRLYAEVAEEKERLSQQAARQRAELEELRQQLEANSSALTKALKEEYAKEKEEHERRHQAEVKVLKDRLEMEKQAWEANYMKKEEAWLLSRERELREEVRKERDKEIELVIQRLEADMSSAKEECERAAENRIKRIRDKYEAELQELERSERKLQERCSELKGRLAELEGQSLQLQGLLKHKEQELQEISKVRDQLAQERSSLADVIRQEFADRLVGTEEENRQLKTEMAEMRARQRLELDRVVREKDEELEEVHRR
uniref:Centrosomal protein 131 n=1 Tax=Nothoprocta perdicaria TaxID=30464 RepID=A0A8C7EEG5_NOTPE